MLGCGCGTCCKSCASKGKLNGFGSAPVTEFPRTQAVLLKYVMDQLRARKSFYLSPTVNSATLYPHYLSAGLGQLDDIISAVSGLASTVGSAIGIVKSVSGSSTPSSASPSTTDQVTAQVIANLQADGINLPSSVAGSTVGAGLADLFGPTEMPWWLVGGGLLLLVVLLR